jgi:hypothetical protein
VDLETLAIRFITQGEDAVRGVLQSLSNDGEQLGSKLSTDVADGFSDVMTNVVKLIGVWEAASLFKRMIEDAGALAVKLEVFSQQTGISAEKLGEIGEQAELSFVPVDSLRSAFLRLAMSMGDANSRGAVAMKSMGLDVKSFHGDTEKAFTAIAEKFAGYRDDANKSALMTAIFGRGGQMTPLLNQFKETQAEVKKLGQTMTTEQQGALLDMEHSFVRLKIVADGFGRQIATETAPALQALAEAFTVNLQEGEQFNVVAELIGGTARFLATVVLLVEGAFLILGHAIGDTINIMAEAFPNMREFSNILLDIVTQNWAKLAIDIATPLQQITRNFAEMDREIKRDAKETMAQLKNLYGFGDEAGGPKRTPGTKSAPMAKPAKDPDDGKAELKAMLDAYKQEAEVAKANYDLQAKIAEDSQHTESEKWAKIKALDQAYLAFLVDMYDEGSKEYLDQLTVMEEHQKAHNEHEMAEAKKQTQALNAQIDARATHDEQLLKERERVAQQWASDVSQAIGSAFKAGLSKGGTAGGALVSFGDSLLKSLGTVFIQMGEKSAAASPALAVIRAGLSNIFTAPEASLAGGLALIALGEALNAIGNGSGGGGGGGGGGPVGMASTIHFGGSATSTPGGNAASGTSGMKGAGAPINMTIIGPNDPIAQRGMLELLAKANAR